MPLPQSIDLVLAQRTPSGSYLGQLAEIQVLDLVGIGQGQFIETEHFPASGTWWALIVYKISLLNSMVPNSFTLVVRHGGRYIQNNTIVTSTVLNQGIDCLAIITRSDTLAIKLTNNSTVLAPMTYAYGYSLHFLAVSSLDLLENILEIWRRMAGVSDG